MSEDGRVSGVRTVQPPGKPDRDRSGRSKESGREAGAAESGAGARLFEGFSDRQRGSCSPGGQALPCDERQGGGHGLFACGLLSDETVMPVMNQ